MAPPQILIPEAPALVVHPKEAHWLSADGEWEVLSLAEARKRVQQERPLLCHRGAAAARLRIPSLAAFDLLELFAFVHPARFVLPTIAGLASFSQLEPPKAPEEYAESLLSIAHSLLSDLVSMAKGMNAMQLAERQGIAWVMAKAGWGFGPAVVAALGTSEGRGTRALRIWDRLPEWQENPPPSPPSSHPVSSTEARARLAKMLGEGAEQRPGQSDYASAATLSFAPREQAGTPNVVLAEAGTGTGKTLGYIAPASLWAEKNQAPVWISTYTRNLQRQLDGELSRLYPDAKEKAAHVAIRKGRENYVCLLNLEEAAMRLAARGADGPSEDTILLGFMVLWAGASRDGDLIGGDLPGWLFDLLGKGRVLALADRRGECIFSACPHYRKCFIERTIRRAKQADIVVANHALVLMQAAFGGIDESYLPTRYVFDEGHHLFDAADKAFAAQLSGLETAELRRWILGAENEGRQSRARGLRRRVEDLIKEKPEALDSLQAAIEAASHLPATGWRGRVVDGEARGETEIFLKAVREQVYARASGLDGPYGLECDAKPLNPGLEETAQALAALLRRLSLPLENLVRGLKDRLSEEADRLDKEERQRIEALMRSIERRALSPLGAWIAMLKQLSEETPPDFVDWFAVERGEGRDLDVGFHRHWIDPTLPYAHVIAQSAHGLMVTSATLRDSSGDVEADWLAAERRTGAIHLPKPPLRAALASPFDYKDSARVLIVTDVRKDDLDQVAAAYRELFRASGGGGLGLFTAITRLKAVFGRIANPLDEAGIDLFAQHMGGMDISTAVEVFRGIENACLLGTDAVRDGVDVPGRSLRLIVFDRVPWPRPDILHRARRANFGGKAYDDMIARLRLKQAFGRLIRRAGDQGVFVLLDPMTPSRLFGAFPENVQPQRMGLAEAIQETRLFLKNQNKEEPGG